MSVTLSPSNPKWAEGFNDGAAGADRKSSDNIYLDGYNSGREFGLTSGTISRDVPFPGFIEKGL
jgi:hypothetical protein